MTGSNSSCGYTGLSPLRRARAYRLYDAGGRRYLDMYQEHGTAILGHRPEGMQRVFKSASAKGLWASFPSSHGKALEKAAGQLLLDDLPDLKESAVRVRLYPSLECLKDAFGIRKVLDPLFVPSASLAASLRGGEGALLWRPFISELWPELFTSLQSEGVPGFPVLMCLPVPGGFIPQVIARLDLSPGPSPSSPVPDGKPVSPAMAAVATHAVLELKRTMKEAASFDSSHTETGESVRSWPRFGRRPWRRVGPYLIWDEDPLKYDMFRRKSLERGIVLPADSGDPAIIPFEYTDGEIKPFLFLMEELYGDI
jgi:hypothetical protein